MEITVRGQTDLKALAKAIRRSADAKALRLELTRGLREEVRPVVAAVKAAYGGGKHLRPALARATRAEVRTTGRFAGARVRVDGRRMPPGMGSLPAMYEGLKRWRHPVFGNRDNWVTQAPHPTFYPTVEPYTARIEQRLDELANQIVAKIEQGR